jgi:hypothetical protein
MVKKEMAATTVEDLQCSGEASSAMWRLWRCHITNRWIIASCGGGTLN